MARPTLGPSNEGYAVLCLDDIAGITKVTTPQTWAHWPQCPSDVLTGLGVFINTGL